MRMFIAIPLSAQATAELSALSLQLRSGTDSFRWSAPESWHITLQFLGNISEEQYTCIVSRLSDLHLPNISITFGAFGFFERAGIFYVDVCNTERLKTLQQTITAATGLCGCTAEDRPYHPHITLARIKGKQDIHALARLKAIIPRTPPFTTFRAETFILYESFTGPSGSRYEARESFAFNNIEAP